MNANCAMPRLLIAGLSGGSGKTLVTMGLLLLLRRAGVDVRAFKKGPDYIDASWLAWASGHTARNLDAWLMGQETARNLFQKYAISDGVNLIEGNRGLFDGVDAAGRYSSAALAATLNAPIVLVIDATKMTRTAAALVLGCQKLEPGGLIQGVLLNNVNGDRHERILREAIESECSVPVIGALPRMKRNPLPERHLGLVPPEEHEEMDRLEQSLLAWMEKRIDLDAMLAIVRGAAALEHDTGGSEPLADARGLRIGYLRDAAFSFYYPENLEELERAGAELVRISALDALTLPAGLHALYIGGGFPETHARALSANSGFLESLREACAAGLPVYAECGGLMLLARSLSWKGVRFPMAAVLPADVEAFAKPQGHGYSELVVDAPNPFFPHGTHLRGHEFHYSRIVSGSEGVASACAVIRGTGCFAGRDGLVVYNTMAMYTHLHATATPEWGVGMIAAASEFAARTKLLSVAS
ncbi:Cobyrinic acid A,C-diamide synthase [Candidatus Sulfotelmatomonas gaucii]|uniref:Cobyrinate a,c-diamide synthase n=1 Tax=Candidatus Sulfuritelmatomonas gaucii TaxID=2043161 RepID=A0A2N9M611_9BACT|nr:Cobyrinic acid A,C-diamide synthase [Candidatus Sulfotelmatomonas gaucii]